MTRALLLSLSIAGALLGCAPEWSRHGVPVTPPRLRMAVLPARTSVAMSTGALAQFDSDLLEALHERAEIEIVSSTQTADAILEPNVAGYGKLKRRWLFWLIGSGVVEGAAEGALLAPVAGPWAAVGVAAEEAAQETVEWGGGAFAFNRIFTPVIIEARLRSGKDGAEIWTKSVLASRDRKALKAYSQEQRKDRTLRLMLTARKAARELAERLAKAIRRAR